MDYSKPTLLIISGPNGAGKSTHIQNMLPDDFKDILSFDRDQTRGEFARRLLNEGFDPDKVTAEASKRMENLLVTEMKKSISLRKHFVLETPLSHPDYWRYIDLFVNSGYQVQLNYLCLDKISDCIARVGQRVMEGGHYVAPNTIKGVYEKNLEFINQFMSSFNAIELYDGMKFPSLLVKMEDNTILYADTVAPGKKWIQKGLPVIAGKINVFLKNFLIFNI